LADLGPRAFRRFNLLIGDALDSFFVRHVANGSIRILKPGLFMVTAREPDDPACAWICW
jgi:hypothetical protein